VLENKPGQVLENKVGFDRGLFVSQMALWQALGYYQRRPRSLKSIHGML